MDVISRGQRFTLLLEFLDVSLCLSWSESTQELQLVVPMFMVNEEIDVNSDAIDSLHIYLLEDFNETCLVNLLLKWMKVDVQHLVFTHNWTPKI
jgi:hypothetical protein